MNKSILLFLLVSVSFLLSGCFDKDLTNIDDEINYRPEYSLPIGENVFDMAYIVDEYESDLLPVLDTATFPDSLPLFYYNGDFFTGPGTFIFEEFDVIDLSFLAGESEYVTSAMIRSNAVNKLPAYTRTQVYFLDATDQIIDSLYQDGWLELEPAVVDTAGNLLQQTELWRHDEYLSEELINRLPDIYTLHSITEVEIIDYTTEQVQYIPEQDVWLQLGLRIELDIPLNEP